jgi:hypothetical protein
MREQAWLFMVILQDCGMRPDEVFPMRIEKPAPGCKSDLDTERQNGEGAPVCCHE